jgi:putative colanic acid biosynthesis UDP-glucose lipid carrier transferase
MTQPVLLKQSFLIAIMTGIQAVVPAVVAVASLGATITLFGHRFDPSSAAVVIVGVLCLVLVQPPREVSTQLTSARLTAVTDVIMRWMLLLAVLLAVGYVTKSLNGFSRRIFLTWAAATPVALIAVTLAMQEVMRRFLMNAFDNRSAIIAGYNPGSLELARRLKSNPGMRIEVAGFFDDRSSDRLGMESDSKLIGSLSDMSQYVKDNRTDVIFIALPIRHVKRVMNLLDDLRDTTASIYYVPDIFVFDLIQARSGEIHGIPVVAMCETPFYGYRGVAKRLTDIGFSALIL